MKNYIIFFCFFIFVAHAKAQYKCDSFFVIKVYDSVTKKRLKDATVEIPSYSDKYSFLATKTNKKGVAKFRLPERLNPNKAYTIKVSQLGYEYKWNIVLSPDCDCIQKIYMVRWAKDKEIIR